jgi:hypothetical protein
MEWEHGVEFFNNKDDAIEFVDRNVQDWFPSINNTETKKLFTDVKEKSESRVDREGENYGILVIIKKIP